MAYRIVNKFTKDDSKPWPWDRQDLSWLDEVVDLFAQVRALGNNTPKASYEDTIAWLQTISTDPTQLMITHDFDTQSKANEFVLKLYEIIIEHSTHFESWGNECGYDNILHAIDINEI
jgi:hypothetical protein